MPCLRRKEKAISSHLREQITHVTFLNRREISNVELIFGKALEIAQVVTETDPERSTKFEGAFNGGEVYSCVRQWSRAAHYHFHSQQTNGRQDRRRFYVSHKEVKSENNEEPNGSKERPFHSVKEAQKSELVWEQLIRPEYALVGVEILIQMSDAKATVATDNLGRCDDGNGQHTGRMDDSPRSPQSARRRPEVLWVPNDNDIFNFKVLLVPAVSTGQLRVLPEWTQNMFLERLVRIFSQTGLQVLTLLELIDLYSALHRRAEFSWKAPIAFCLYDFDEDGVLDSGDMYRTIRQMVYKTKMMELGGAKDETRQWAATKIQAAFRGNKSREKQKTEGKPVSHRIQEKPLQAFVRRVLQTCDCVQKGVMDFRFFQKHMKSCDDFTDNFSVEMTRSDHLGRIMKQFQDDFRRERSYEEEIRKEALQNLLDGNNGKSRAASLKEKVDRAKRREQLVQELDEFANGFELSCKLDEEWTTKFRKRTDPTANTQHPASLASWEREMVHHICYEKKMYSCSHESEGGGRFVQIFMETSPNIPEEAKRHRRVYEQEAQKRREAEREVISGAAGHLLDSGLHAASHLLHVGATALTFDNPLSQDDRHGHTPRTRSPTTGHAGHVETRVLTEAQLESDTIDASDDAAQSPKSRELTEREQKKMNTMIKMEARARRLFEQIGEVEGETEHISMDGFEKLLAALDDGFLPGDGKIIFENIVLDTNGNGNLSIYEFLAWYTERSDALLNEDQDLSLASPDGSRSPRQRHSPSGRPSSPSELVDTDMSSPNMRQDMSHLDNEIRRVHTEEGDYDYHRGSNRSSVHKSMPYPVGEAMRPPLLRIRLERYQDVMARRQVHRKKVGEGGTVGERVKLSISAAEQETQDTQYMSLFVSAMDDKNSEDVKAVLGQIVGENNVHITVETGFVWLKVGTNQEIRDACMRAATIAIRKLGMKAKDMGMLETPASLSAAISTEHMLEQYRNTNGSIFERALMLWEDVDDFIGTYGLWEYSIKILGHKLGHGIAELLRIYKFMILLNLGLGTMWIALVILPRDYSEHGVGASLFNVLRAAIFVDRYQQYTRGHSMYIGSVSLYYDGYRQIQGVFGRMDVCYFFAILLNIFISLFVLLRSLGLKLNNLASGSSVGGLVGSGGTVKAGVEGKWSSLFSSYDCSLVDHPDHLVAQEMRQGIRQRIEMAVINHTEKMKAVDGWKRIAQEGRTLLGLLLTVVLIIVHILVVMTVMKYERTLNKQFGMIAPLCLSIIDNCMPLVIISIVDLENHASSTEILITTLNRVYLFKMLQLLVMGISLLQIMSVYVEKVPTMPSECQAFTEACTCPVIDSDELADRATANTEYDTAAQSALGFFYDEELSENGPDEDDPQCAEARLGSLFFAQIISDTVVTIILELYTMFLVKHGLPIPWKWNEVVNKFRHQWFAEAKGYTGQDVQENTTEETNTYAAESTAESTTKHYKKSQKLRKIRRRRVVKNNVAQWLMTGKRSRETGVDTTWWYLERHPSGSETQAVKPSRAFLDQRIEDWFQIIADMAVHPDNNEDSLHVEARVEHGIRKDQTTAIFEGSWLGLAARTYEKTTERQEDSDKPIPQKTFETPSDSFTVMIDKEGYKMLRKGDKLSFLQEDSPIRKSSAAPRSPRQRSMSLTDDPVDSVVQDFEIVVQSTRPGDQEDCVKADKKSEGNEVVEVRIHLPRGASCALEPGQTISIGPTRQDIQDQREKMRKDMSDNQEKFSTMLRAAADELYKQTVVARRNYEWSQRAANKAETRVSTDEDADNFDGMTVKHFLEEMHAHANDETGGEKEGAYQNAAQNERTLEDKIRSRVGNQFPVYLMRQLYFNLRAEGTRENGHWQDVTSIVHEKRMWKQEPTVMTNFDSAVQIIELLYAQTFVWIGAPFCPWLPLTAACCQIMTFTVRKYAMNSDTYRPPKEPWSAGQMENMFLRYALLTLLFCVLPMTMWMNQEPLCGPHQGFQVFATVGVYMSEEGADSFLSKLGITFLLRYLVNPPALIIIIFVMYTRYRFTKAALSSKENEYDTLARAYHNDKEFLVEQCRAVAIVAPGQGDETSRVHEMHIRHQQSMLEWGTIIGLSKNADYAKEIKEFGLDIDRPSKMQNFMDMAAQFDLDHNGLLGGEEIMQWQQYAKSASVWVGNIPRDFCTDEFLRRQLESHFGEVASCTACKYTKEQEQKELNLLEQSGESDDEEVISNHMVADGTIYKHRSWAIVTFFRKFSAERCLGGNLRISEPESKFRSSHATLEFEPVKDLTEEEEEGEEGEEGGPATAEPFESPARILQNHLKALQEKIESSISIKTKLEKQQDIARQDLDAWLRTVKRRKKTVEKEFDSQSQSSTVFESELKVLEN